MFECIFVIDLELYLKLVVLVLLADLSHKIIYCNLHMKNETLSLGVQEHTEFL